MEKEIVHIKKVVGTHCLQHYATTLTLNFDEGENSGNPVVYKAGFDPTIVKNLKRAFDINSLVELEGMEATIYKRSNGKSNNKEDSEVLAIGTKTGYLYKSQNALSSFVEESKIEELISSLNAKQEQALEDR